MGKLLRNHRRNTSPFDIIEKKDNMKVKSIENVNMDKEIGLFTTNQLLKKRNHSTGVFHLTQSDVDNIAKYFYELGLKTQKK